MRRIDYLLLLLLLLALPVLGLVTVVHAQSFRSGNSVTVPAGTTVNNTLFVAGRTLNIDGNVNGDLFCAGENVTVSGRVNGDVVCAGQNLTVSGQVSGDVRLAGQNVTLGALVGGNATVGAQNFTQQSRSVISGDITVGGQDSTLNGKIGRDVAGGNNTLTIGGPVGRNITADVGHLRLESGARVAGNVTYTSANAANRSQGAEVTGKVTRHTPTQTHHGWSPYIGWAFGLYLYIACILVALVLALLLPGLFERAVTITRGHLGTTFLVGLISSIVVPVVLALLMATILGIPLALLAGLLWVLAVLLAGPFAAYLLGRRLLGGSRHAVLVMLVGAAILFLLYLLPFVGWLFWLVGTWFGLGVLLRLARGIGRPYHDADTKTPAVA